MIKYGLEIVRQNLLPSPPPPPEMWGFLSYVLIVPLDLLGLEIVLVFLLFLGSYLVSIFDYQILLIYRYLGMFS